VLVNGALAAYISRGARQILVYLPEDEPARSTTGRALAAQLAVIGRGEDWRGGLLIGDINSVPAKDHAFAPYLEEAGFHASPMGYQMRRA
jgi:ATP-dependent Lhr-like helicase